MFEHARIRIEKIPKLLELYKEELHFKMDTPPYFLYHKKNRNRKGKEEDPIEVVKKVLIDMKTLLES